MATLREKLGADEVRPKVIRACEDLVDAEVASKRGFAGAAVKAAYRIIKAIKPGMVANVLEKLLPEFADALEPLHAASISLAEHTGRPPSEAFAGHLSERDHEAADALLGVTDKRADRARNKVIKKTYQRLRRGAHDHVRAAVPNLARTIAPFI